MGSLIFLEITYKKISTFLLIVSSASAGIFLIIHIVAQILIIYFLFLQLKNFIRPSKSKKTISAENSLSQNLDRIEKFSDLNLYPKLRTQKENILKK